MTLPSCEQSTAFDKMSLVALALILLAVSVSKSTSGFADSKIGISNVEIWPRFHMTNALCIPRC